MSRKKYVKNKDAENKIKMAAEYISQELCKQGCMIHRYDAYSTNSVYLKVDAGIACSIRLSDHKGYAYLKYRFNFLANEPGNQVEHIVDAYDRYFYTAGAVDQLIDDVLLLRLQRMRAYRNYSQLVDRALTQSKSKKGFWQQAYRVSAQQDSAA